MWITKKLLAGGTAAVGSVATVAVVKNQYGSSPNNREKVINWLKNKKTEGKNWKIEFKDCEETKKLTEIDPKGLPEYLSRNDKLLESIASGKNATFTLRRNKSGEWENIFTKEQILEWVKNTSKGRATLKLAEENQSRELDAIKDLNQFFKSLEKEKTLFNSGLENYSKTNRKTILFEKYLGDWYHTLTVIKKWEKDNNFEAKIKKDEVNVTDENDLVGLMYHFGSNEVQWKSSRYRKSKEKEAWTFKKEGGKWKTIYNKDTINSWIDDISDKKAKLELYGEDGTKKELSGINNNDELGQLFDAIIQKENLFKRDFEGYDGNNKKTVVFEKYGKDGENKTWLHVKLAIRQLIIDTAKSCGECKLKPGQIEIQTNDQTKEKKNIKEAKDEKLIGLLKHIKGQKEEYKKETKLTLKKNGDNWEKVASS